MKFSLIASAIALASAVSAAPAPQGYGQCISQSEGEAWLNTFIGVLAHTDKTPKKTANKITADKFVEYSNSILSLTGQTLDGHPSEATKADWVNGITAAPPPAGINTEQVIVACDKLVWLYHFDKVGSGKYPVRGFNLFHLIRNGKQIQMDRLDIELDSIAFGLNTGAHYTYANGTTVPK